LVGLGVAPARLTAGAHGPAKAACPANDTDECKAKNARVVVQVTAK
jgi:K(+)-stimulated pyrophosphate-energized sodium pump